ncbi:MAG: hypothetical protein FK732_05220 [Asgard group archaeon]|nr:hypothetical protein [Asgard group archaeon]
MSVWRNKTYRSIMFSSIFLVLVIALILFISFFDIETNDVQSLRWLFIDGVMFTLVILLFWGLYFFILLLVGSIREKMNALPGWTEVIISMIITLLPAIFIGNTGNYPIKWIVFGGTALGVVLITLWFIMSSTPKEEATAKS